MQLHAWWSCTSIILENLAGSWNCRPISHKALINKQRSCQRCPSTEVLDKHNMLNVSVPNTSKGSGHDLCMLRLQTFRTPFCIPHMSWQICCHNSAYLKDEPRRSSPTHRQNGVAISQTLLVNCCVVAHAYLLKSRESVNRHDLCPARPHICFKMHLLHNPDQ